MTEDLSFGCNDILRLNLMTTWRYMSCLFRLPSIVLPLKNGRGIYGEHRSTLNGYSRKR